MATGSRKKAVLVLFVKILSLLLSSSCATAGDCNPDENATYLKSMKRGGMAVSKMNPVLGGIYDLAAKALDSGKDNMFKCFAAIIQVAKKNHRLSIRIAQSHHNEQIMLSLLIQANAFLDDCSVVRQAYAELLANNETSTKTAFNATCGGDNKPTGAVTKFADFVQQHDLFKTLITVTSHSDNLYSKTGISLINQTALCAVLAHKCRETLHPHETEKARNASRNTTLAALAKIEEAFRRGRDALMMNYTEAAEHDLRHMLDTEDLSRRNRQKAIDKIYEFMTSKYPFRAWALMIFDEKDMWGNKIPYEQIGKKENIFIMNEHEIVLIAYSANRENRICDSHRKILHKKTLRRVLAADYQKLTINSDDLIESLFVVKEWMQGHKALPAEEFGLIVVHYSLGFVSKRDSDRKHYHFEYIKNHRRGKQIEQCILIGWC